MLGSRSVARRSPKSQAAPKSPPAPKRRGPGRPPRHDTNAGSQFPGARVIKRYGNRRLYDGGSSRCVTMEEIGELVRKGEDVRVVDGDTGEDLTRRIFTQIILEQGNARQLELLPVELLRKLIAIKSEPMGRWLEQYLSAGAQFLERQMTATGPAAKAVKESMDAMFPWLKANAWVPTVEPPPGPAPFAPSEAANAMDDEIAELRRKLADLSARVKRR